jgi:hypothetical protein
MMGQISTAMFILLLLLGVAILYPLLPPVYITILFNFNAYVVNNPLTDNEYKSQDNAAFSQLQQYFVSLRKDLNLPTPTCGVYQI